jgi:hypothetical protein
MPLSPIAADPEPTEAEIATIITGDKMLSSLDETTDVDDGPPFPSFDPRGMARVEWYSITQRRTPDDFLVPFVEWAFPDDNNGYDEYLASPLWKAIRARVLKSAAYKCACCPSRATEVHHRDYRPRVLRGEDDSPLVALCRNCHHEVDKDSNDKARSMWQEKEAILAKMVRREDSWIAQGGL